MIDRLDTITSLNTNSNWVSNKYLVQYKDNIILASTCHVPARGNNARCYWFYTVLFIFNLGVMDYSPSVAFALGIIRLFIIYCYSPLIKGTIHPCCVIYNKIIYIYIYPAEMACGLVSSHFNNALQHLQIITQACHRWLNTKFHWHNLPFYQLVKLPT